MIVYFPHSSHSGTEDNLIFTNIRQGKPGYKIFFTVIHSDSPVNPCSLSLRPPTTTPAPIIKLFIFPGNEKVLRDVCARQREKVLHTDSRGWSPLHEAAVQTNHNILELVFAGRDSEHVGCAQTDGNGKRTVKNSAVQLQALSLCSSAPLWARRRSSWQQNEV